MTHLDLAHRASGPKKIDSPLWTTGLAFWGAIGALVLLMLWFVFVQSPAARGGASGDVRINRIGDVVAWSDEAAEITGVPAKDALHRDFFAMLPARKQEFARREFVKAADDGPYAFPGVAWAPDVWVTFRKGNGAYVATITRRQ